jgi:hypothetical protein
MKTAARQDTEGGVYRMADSALSDNAPDAHRLSHSFGASTRAG